MCVRSEEVVKSQSHALALAVAAGVSIPAWSKSSRVPLRTAYRIARKPGFRTLVTRYRGKLENRLINLLCELQIGRLKASGVKPIRLAWPKRSEVSKQVS